MADITKCLNTDCPLRKQCYRVTAPSNKHRQSISIFNYTTTDGVVQCDHFWDNKKGTKE